MRQNGIGFCDANPPPTQVLATEGGTPPTSVVGRRMSGVRSAGANKSLLGSQFLGFPTTPAVAGRCKPLLTNEGESVGFA